MEVCALCKVAAVEPKLFAVCAAASCRKVKQRTKLSLRHAGCSFLNVFLVVTGTREAIEMWKFLSLRTVVQGADDVYILTCLSRQTCQVFCWASLYRRPIVTLSARILCCCDANEP